MTTFWMNFRRDKNLTNKQTIPNIFKTKNQSIRRNKRHCCIARRESTRPCNCALYSQHKRQSMHVGRRLVATQRELMCRCRICIRVCVGDHRWRGLRRQGARGAWWMHRIQATRVHKRLWKRYCIYTEFLCASFHLSSLFEHADFIELYKPKESRFTGFYEINRVCRLFSFV